MGQPSSEMTPSDKPVKDRLDSWKEIATYVNRDITTVQRWEKREGMPVYRHLHDKRGSVYAFSSELNAWIESRRRRLEEEAKEQERIEEVGKQNEEIGSGVEKEGKLDFRSQASFGGRFDVRGGYDCLFCDQQPSADHKATEDHLTGCSPSQKSLE